MTRYALAAVIVLWLTASAVVERQNADIEIGWRRDENFALRAAKRELIALKCRREIEYAELSRRVSWVQWSQRGECHPEILAIMRESWESGQRRLTWPAFRRWVFVESRFNPLSRGAEGAVGLLQVKGGPWEPRANLDAAQRHLEGNLARSRGDLKLALRMFNWGEARVLYGVTDSRYEAAILGNGDGR